MNISIRDRYPDILTSWENDILDLYTDIHEL